MRRKKIFKGSKNFIGIKTYALFMKNVKGALKKNNFFNDQINHIEHIAHPISNFTSFGIDIIRLY